MRIQKDLEQFCRSLGIREAMLLSHSGTGSNIVASFGIRPKRQAAALQTAASLQPGKFVRGRRPGFQSSILMGHEVLRGLDHSHESCRLVVGARAGLAGARDRGRVLAAHLAASLENGELRGRLARVSRAATLGNLALQTAHDLNDPLTSVVNLSDLFLRQRSKASQSRETAERLKAEAERALEITRGMLSLGRRQGRKELLDWNALVRQALDLRARFLKQAGVQVKLELSAKPLRILGQPLRLVHAVANILRNAEQALEGCRSSRIVVRTRLRHRRERSATADAILEVANNGPRIAPEVLPRIFDPFFTTKPAGQGTGLGLSLAHAAVMDAGGSLSAENVAPGDFFPEGGVRFRLVLPAVHARSFRVNFGGTRRRQSAPAAVTAARYTSRLRSGRRILVVEDSAPLARLIKEALTPAGYRVEVSTTVERALEAIEAQRFDLVISDLRLPRGGGPWLLGQLRRRSPWLARRVLFVTGDSVSPPADSFLREAARPVLAKPFHVDELVAAVARAVEEAEMQEAEAAASRKASS